MDPIENCPKCGSKMEKGYIITFRMASRDEYHGNDSIIWKEKRPGLMMTELGFRLLPTRIYESYSEAYRCQNCKLILLHYGEE